MRFSVHCVHQYLLATKKKLVLSLVFLSPLYNSSPLNVRGNKSTENSLEIRYFFNAPMRVFRREASRRAMQFHFALGTRKTTGNAKDFFFINSCLLIACSFKTMHLRARTWHTRV